MEPAAFTMKAPGICREIRTKCWISGVCDPNLAWPEIADLSEIPQVTQLPAGETIRFRQFSALWDTGCMSASAISDRVVAECGLKPVGPATVTMPVGRIAPRASEIYRVNIGLPNHVIVTDLPVVRVQQQAGADVLIGMDIISLGDFSLTNFLGKTIFSFRMPSLAPVDFTEGIGGAVTVLGARVA